MSLAGLSGARTRGGGFDRAVAAAAWVRASGSVVRRACRAARRASPAGTVAQRVDQRVPAGGAHNIKQVRLPRRKPRRPGAGRDRGPGTGRGPVRSHAWDRLPVLRRPHDHRRGAATLPGPHRGSPGAPAAAPAAVPDLRRRSPARATPRPRRPPERDRPTARRGHRGCPGGAGGPGRRAHILPRRAGRRRRPGGCPVAVRGRARADRAGVRSGRAPRGPRATARRATRTGAADPAHAVLRRDDPDRDRPPRRALPDARLPTAVTDPGPATPPTGCGLTDERVPGLVEREVAVPHPKPASRWASGEPPRT